LTNQHFIVSSLIQQHKNSLRFDDLNHALYPQKFEVDGENKDAAMITGIPPRFGEEYGGHLDGVNLITSIKRRIAASEHWVWDTWEGDVEEYFNAYVIKKT
jgi:hypothetical protein